MSVRITNDIHKSIAYEEEEHGRRSMFLDDPRRFPIRELPISSKSQLLVRIEYDHKIRKYNRLLHFLSGTS